MDKNTYQAGTCPVCKTKMVRKDREIDKTRGVYRAGYEECPKCHHKKQR